MLAPSWWILRHLGPMLDCLGSMLGHVGPMLACYESLEACWRSVEGLLVILMHRRGALCTHKRSQGQSYAQASGLGHPQRERMEGRGGFRTVGLVPQPVARLTLNTVNCALNS